MSDFCEATLKNKEAEQILKTHVYDQWVPVQNSMLHVGIVTKAIRISKGKQMQGYYRLNTPILSDTYKYLNYMFRPLLPSSGWVEYQRKKIHNTTWYSTNISVV